MTRIVRAALTETRNQFAGMPENVEDLDELSGRLEEIRQANLDHHLQLVDVAHEAGVQLICFGELFTGPYFALERRELWRDLAESAENGPTVTQVSAKARERSVVVIAPIYEIDPKTRRRFNAALVIDADGTLMGSYRKCHIPEGHNESGDFHETYYYERSEAHPLLPVFATRYARIGVATCYDRHFEGVVSTLAGRGAEIVFSPAVTFGTQSQRLWSMEFPVDAARHRVYIGGSNRRGAERPWNVTYFGSSFFCGPDFILPNRSDHPNLIVADLDLDALTERDASGWDLARDRRDDLAT